MYIMSLFWVIIESDIRENVTFYRRKHTKGNAI